MKMLLKVRTLDDRIKTTNLKKGRFYMSIESAKAFRKKMEDDLEFVEKVNVIETLEELKAFILEEGYDFTVAEFKEANDAIYNKELNEDELENVVGGSTMRTPPIIKSII